MKYKIPNSVQLIAEERTRLIEKEGWTASHDDGHKSGELSRGAGAYVHYSYWQVNSKPVNRIPEEWPWDKTWWKPSDDPIRNLVKAGALIAAEIDRIRRKNEGSS